MDFSISSIRRTAVSSMAWTGRGMEASESNQAATNTEFRPRLPSNTPRGALAPDEAGSTDWEGSVGNTNWAKPSAIARTLRRSASRSARSRPSTSAAPSSMRTGASRVDSVPAGTLRTANASCSHASAGSPRLIFLCAHSKRTPRRAAALWKERCSSCMRSPLGFLGVCRRSTSPEPSPSRHSTSCSVSSTRGSAFSIHSRAPM
mmetsp:Transcript_25029/g.80689  ORF Transcript_25029/g.80689 Transcript_25029/m.80689 type:complete len:204 (+) Transcript_25029:279-890(+)